MVIWGLLFAIVVLLLGTVANIIFSGWVERKIDPAVDLFWQFSHTPIGVVALLFVVALCAALSIAIFIALWDSGPRRVKVARVSRDDRDEIQAIREAWELHGDGPSGLLHELFTEAVYAVNKHQYLAPLLEIKAQDLHGSRRRMDRVLADKTSSLDSVIEVCNTLYGHYISAFKWLFRMSEKESVLKVPGFQERLDMWRRLHGKLHGRMLALWTRPALKGRIKPFPDVAGDAEFARFVQSAENANEDEGTPQ